MQAPNQAVAWDFVEKISKIVLPFLVGITTIDSVPKLKLLAWTIFLCEGYLALEFNLSYLGGYNRLRIEGFGPMDNNCNAIALVICLGMSLGTGLHEKVWWRKILALGVSILIVHAILISFSRGGMLGLGVTGLVTFLLMPKQPKHYVIAILGILLVLRLAGSEVTERFSQTFADSSGKREASAQSRLDLWADCWDVMQKKPLFGAGPQHWPLIAADYGWRPGKEAHTLWLSIGAELGFPGMILLILFYLICVVRLWPLLDQGNVPDPWLCHASRMVIASLAGFALSAQFVSMRVLEQPYYVALVGAGVLKLSSRSIPQGPVPPCVAPPPQTRLDYHG
jgi:O-antigen ligase